MHETLTERIDRRAFIGLGVGAAAWACARPGRQGADTTASPASKLTITQATTEIAVGDRRLSFAFLLDNKPTSPDNEGALNALLVSTGGGSPLRVKARPESIRSARGRRRARCMTSRSPTRSPRAFVHFEVWKDDQSVGQNPSPTFAEWRLPGEQFVFFIGEDGLVKDRWSGALGEAETTRAIEDLIEGRL